MLGDVILLFVQWEFTEFLLGARRHHWCEERCDEGGADYISVPCWKEQKPRASGLSAARKLAHGIEMLDVIWLQAQWDSRAQIMSPKSVILHLCALFSHVGVISGRHFPHGGQGSSWKPHMYILPGGEGSALFQMVAAKVLIRAPIGQAGAFLPELITPFVWSGGRVWRATPWPPIELGVE